MSICSTCTMCGSDEVIPNQLHCQICFELACDIEKCSVPVIPCVFCDPEHSERDSCNICLNHYIQFRNDGTLEQLFFPHLINVNKTQAYVEYRIKKNAIQMRLESLHSEIATLQSADHSNEFEWRQIVFLYDTMVQHLGGTSRISTTPIFR